MRRVDALLAELALAAGIEPVYWDLDGRPHDTTPETQRALLAALGVPSSSDAAIADSLKAVAAERLRSPLRAVTVCRTPAASVNVVLPLTAIRHPVRWMVRCENGDTVEGSTQLADVSPEVVEDADGALSGRWTVDLPGPLPYGRHVLSVSCGTRRGESCLIVAPERAYQPEWLKNGGKRWGVAVQLYSLRSLADWGIGDFGDLTRLAELAGASGGDAVAINPLHATFPLPHGTRSPYWPSSRRFMEPNYLDLDAVPELADCPAAQSVLTSGVFAVDRARAAGGALVDYGQIAALKDSVLRPLVAAIESRRVPALERFIREGGQPLADFATYSAMSESFGTPAWRSWPDEMRHPRDAEVTRWRGGHHHATRFHMVLQWLLDRQLSAATHAMRGMSVGLVRDLAVGISPDGADAWCEQDLYCQGVRIGAPPDRFSPRGQDWGMPPPHPARMGRSGYHAFAAALRANMAYAGALRIDHIMGLQRLFLIPKGGQPADGAYLRYPADDLFGILSLESQRSRCLIIGEDLGTLPAGFRERMARECLLSTRVFYFERHADGLFKRPDAYPAHSVAQANTHDLPTLVGFWQGRDIALQRGEGASRDAVRAERSRVQQLILDALRDQGLLDAGAADDLSPGELVIAVSRFLARSTSSLVLVSLDDVVLSVDPLNVPGTVTEYPNWRRRLPLTLDALRRDPRWLEVARAVRSERPRPAGATA